MFFAATTGFQSRHIMNPQQTHAMPPSPPLAMGTNANAVPRHRTIARALKGLAFLLAALLSISLPTAAKAKDFLKIVDVDAVSITVSVGTDGNSHARYLITDSTKVLLNGLKANARDLRSGMTARVTTGSDGRTALNVTARDAPAHPGGNRGRTG
jgi:hypothetical protein